MLNQVRCAFVNCCFFFNAFIVIICIYRGFFKIKIDNTVKNSCNKPNSHWKLFTLFLTEDLITAESAIATVNHLANLPKSKLHSLEFPVIIVYDTWKEHVYQLAQPICSK